MCCCVLRLSLSPSSSWALSTTVLSDEKGFWRAPEAIPEALDSKIDGNAPAGQQLDALEGWLDRQKDHDAGDWPEAGDFTGGKHDRHASADDFQA